MLTAALASAARARSALRTLWSDTTCAHQERQRPRASAAPSTLTSPLRIGAPHFYDAVGRHAGIVSPSHSHAQHGYGHGDKLEFNFGQGAVKGQGVNDAWT